MVTTVAPTMPVLAAISMPTRMTASARPLRLLASNALMDSSSDSAIRVFSSTTPISTNRGTASMVWLVMIPNSRFGRKPRSDGLKAPVSTPPKANSSATPARVSATG